MAEAEQEATCTLPTPEQTPEPKAQNQPPTNSGPELSLPTPESDQSDDLALTISGPGLPLPTPESDQSDDLDPTTSGPRLPLPTSEPDQSYKPNQRVADASSQDLTSDTCITLKPDRIHSRDLSRVPKTYKELSHYPYSSGFKPAAPKDGYHVSSHCLELRKDLYRLPPSHLLWLNKLAKALKNLGLHPIPGTSCLFYCSRIIVFFYLDDIVIFNT